MAGGYITASIGNDLYACVLQSGVHKLIADEPTENGGNDIGPAPEAFLMMSLAACTAITLRMYVIRKGWQTGEITVKISLEKHADKTLFVRAISCAEALDEDIKMKLLAIANKCPVHKILTNPIEITTILQ